MGGRDRLTRLLDRADTRDDHALRSGIQHLHDLEGRGDPHQRRHAADARGEQHGRQRGAVEQRVLQVDHDKVVAGRRYQFDHQRRGRRAEQPDQRPARRLPQPGLERLRRTHAYSIWASGLFAARVRSRISGRKRRLASSSICIVGAKQSKRAKLSARSGQFAW